MSWNNKIVWSEGMFMRPHHFQQQTRYLENYVEERCAVLVNHAWGFKSLQIDQEALSLGKLSISFAKGVLPDGTPFNIPEQDDPPLPIDIDENVHDAVVYLSLPIKRAGMTDLAYSSEETGVLARYQSNEYQVRDSNSGSDSVAPIELAKLKLQLLLETSHRDEYACLGVAKVVEAQADKKVIIDPEYIPPVLDSQANSQLAAFLKELQGLLHHRGDALSGRVSESGKGGAAEIADFLMLQVVNKYEPLLAHLVDLYDLHPERLYHYLLMLAGELATFTNSNRRPPSYPLYIHDDLQSTFEPIITDLRSSLSMVLEQNAMPIPLEERKYGIHVATINDPSLLENANFVLAVSAAIATEELRRRFPAQVKIGPTEQIRQLVNVQLPGIGLTPLAVAPRQIPYHAGNVYFELDQRSEMWKQLNTSGGFAFHIGGEFPDLNMQFWAIRG